MTPFQEEKNDYSLGFDANSPWSTGILAVAAGIVWTAFLVRLSRRGFGDHLIGPASLAVQSDPLIIAAFAIVLGATVFFQIFRPSSTTLWIWIGAGIGIPGLLTEHLAARNPWIWIGCAILSLPAFLLLAGQGWCTAVRQWICNRAAQYSRLSWVATVGTLLVSTIFFFEAYLPTLAGRNGPRSISCWIGGGFRYFGPISDPTAPLLIQAVVLAVAAFPLFHFAKTVTASRGVAFAIACLYLIHPACHTSSLRGFSASNTLPLIIFSGMSFVARADDRRSVDWRLGTLISLGAITAILIIYCTSTIPPLVAKQDFVRLLFYLAVGVIGLGLLPILSRVGASLVIGFVVLSGMIFALWPCELVARSGVIAGWTVCILGAVFTLRQREIALPHSAGVVSRCSNLLVAGLALSALLWTSLIFVQWRGFFLEGVWRVDQARQDRLGVE